MFTENRFAVLDGKHKHRLYGLFSNSVNTIGIMSPSDKIEKLMIIWTKIG